MALTKRGVIHRHEDDFSSILHLSIDEVRYALDISLEGWVTLVRLQSNFAENVHWTRTA
jgi:hypothetical protein